MSGTPTTILPFGPQHPVLPEPIHLRLTLEDEKVVGVAPAIGYVHRGIEKAAELREYTRNVFLVERVCGICSFVHALAYCQVIEDAMKVEIPPRAKYLRVVYSELTRIHSHLLYLGLLADALGFESLFMQAWRVRETVVDLMEKTAGSRVIISACSIGGVRRDVDDALRDDVLRTIREMRPEVDRIAEVILHDYGIRKRTIGCGVLTKEQSLATGAVGPIQRAVGIASDIRMTGYAAYGELGFEPIVETGGDSYARTVVRLREVYQAMDLANKALEKLPAGEISTRVRGNPEGEAVTLVEAPRGELIYYTKGDGTKNLARLRIRTPTYTNIPPLVTMLPGCELADVPVITLSIDPCISCTER